MTFGRSLIALAMGALVATPLTAASASSTSESTSSFDIMFDGYCDGLHINLPSLGLTRITRTLDGNQTGCHTEGVFGQARPDADGQYGAENSAEFVSVPTYGDFAVVNPDHHWILYGYHGDRITQVNRGTWSFGSPGARSSALPSVYGAAAASTSQRPASSAKDIAFDGTCYGAHLVSPSLGLHRRGTVDGAFTGCRSDAIIGARTEIGKSARKAYVVQYEHSGKWFQMTVFRNHTWRSFGISGDQITSVDQGTWTESS